MRPTAKSARKPRFSLQSTVRIYAFDLLHITHQSWAYRCVATSVKYLTAIRSSCDRAGGAFPGLLECSVHRSGIGIHQSYT